MRSTGIRRLAKAVYQGKNLRFWFCQITGWAGYALVTFLSVTLIDDKVTWPHIGHILLSAILGILTSWPLRYLYSQTFNLPMVRKLVIAAMAVAISSAIWTVSRILVFAWMVGEPAVWGEAHYWYFGSLSIFLSWTVLFFGINYYELLTLEHQKLLEQSALKHQERLGRLQAEGVAREAQLKMLRYQLNPHFLFNTLNAISALIKLNENVKAQKMVRLLAAFLRTSLERNGGVEVSLEEELELVKLYLDIEKVRFEDRLTVEFEIEPNAKLALVPELILQPIIENAMKYVIEPSEEGGVVQVKARVLGAELQLEVSDNGPGLNSENLVQGRGVGLRNTLERLEILYASKYRFEAFDNLPAGLSVLMHLPFHVAPFSHNEPAELL